MKNVADTFERQVCNNL